MMVKIIKMSKDNADKHYSTWKCNQNVPHNYIVTTRWKQKCELHDIVKIEHIDGYWVCRGIVKMPYAFISSIYAAEGFKTQREFVNELYNLYGERKGFYGHEFYIHFFELVIN